MRGYTIVELLVVISLIAIFSTIGIYFTQQVKYAHNLEKAKIFLVSKIHKARSLSLSPKKTGSSQPYGYGIYIPSFPTTKFYLFADLDGDHIWDSNETIEENSLEKLTEIFQAKFSSGALPSQVNILFTPPRAKVYFNNNPNISYLEIILKEKIDNATTTILVNKLGQISF